MAAYGCLWLQCRKSPQFTVPAAGLTFFRIWLRMDAYGVWTHMSAYARLWLQGRKSPQFTVPAAGLTFGRTRLHVDAYGYICPHMHAYARIWTHMAAYGRLWLQGRKSPQFTVPAAGLIFFRT